MNNSVWYPQQGKLHSASSPGESLGPQKDYLEGQGLSLAQAQTISESFSLCIESKHGAGPFLGDIPRQYCSQTLWFDSAGGIFRTLKGIVSDSITTPSGTNICQITKCSGWLTSHPCATWGIAAIHMVKLPNATDYIWVDQKSGLTWSSSSDSYKAVRIRLQASCTSYSAICSVLAD